MNPAEMMVRAEVLGRITTAPKLSHTSEGVAVCRFKVATGSGPASNPVVKPIYVIGDPDLKPSDDLPVRCMGLEVGCLVRVPGVEHQRRRRIRGVEFMESAIRAEDVKLRERAEAGQGGGAA